MRSTKASCLRATARLTLCVCSAANSSGASSCLSMMKRHTAAASDPSSSCVQTKEEADQVVPHARAQRRWQLVQGLNPVLVLKDAAASCVLPCFAWCSAILMQYCLPPVVESGSMPVLYNYYLTKHACAQVLS